MVDRWSGSIEAGEGGGRGVFLMLMFVGWPVCLSVKRLCDDVFLLGRVTCLCWCLLSGVTAIRPEELEFPNTMTDIDYDTWMLRYARLRAFVCVCVCVQPVCVCVRVYTYTYACV